jgi:hypothetical protein
VILIPDRDIFGDKCIGPDRDSSARDNDRALANKRSGADDEFAVGDQRGMRLDDHVVRKVHSAALHDLDLYASTETYPSASAQILEQSAVPDEQ